VYTGLNIFILHYFNYFVKDDAVVDLTLSSDSSPEKFPAWERNNNAEFYNGNKCMPIYTTEKKTFSSEEIVRLLFDATDDALKCTAQPKQVQMNAIFLIDLRYIPLDDLRADGLPQYDSYGGKRTITVEVDDIDGELKVGIVSSQQLEVISPKVKHYQLERLYHSWNVGKDNKYHRRIMHVKMENGAIVNNVACVQYVFANEEEKFVLKLHNSCKNDKGVPYTRTTPSVVRNLDQKLASVGPKDAVYRTTQESGGVMNVECLSDLPRGPRQGYYRNQLQKASLPSHVQGREKKDELLEVILKMKTEKEHLVRKITIEKENTTIVIASDEQLNDLAKFSTSEVDFCTVQIDPTFRLGPYECTPISYRNLMKRKRTGKSPLRLGPVLIHYRKNQNTFSSFLQTLIDLKPQLQGVISTGTDGEQALVNAIEIKFPNAGKCSLRCFRHVQEHFKRALTSFGMAGMQRDIINEVFGKAHNDGIYQPGLLDVETPQDFDASLKSLRVKWKERGDTTERVHKWIEARADMMKTRMIASVRLAARLPPMVKDGNIPSHFYTNDAESNNNRLKSIKQRKSSGFSGTIEAVQRLVETESEEFAQAVAGVSEDFQLREEFQKFVVPDFLIHSQDERTRYINKLSSASMEELHAANSPGSFQWVTNIESTPNSKDSPSDISLDHLKEDARLEVISSSLREEMVKKARLLLENKSVWRGPPTPDGNPTFSVTSFSQERPHYVITDSKTGRVECECANWKTLKLCSHALAVAEREDALHEYIEFYSKQPISKKRNLTRVSNVDVNVGPLGRKGRVVRKRRKKTSSSTVPAPKKSQPSASSSTPRKYTLRWLSESKAYQCYGCNSAIRVPGDVPQAPHDVVAATKEYRSFTKDGKLQVRYGPTHYHLKNECILQKNDDFNPRRDIVISPTDNSRFTNAHAELLLEEFGIVPKKK
jgi:hypothetical protein